MVVELGLDVLATKRLTTLLVDDGITEPLRQEVWKKFPPHKHGPGYVFTCHACMSVWAAGVIASRVLPRPVRDILALSEAALLVINATKE